MNLSEKSKPYEIFSKIPNQYCKYVELTIPISIDHVIFKKMADPFYTKNYD